MWDVRMLPPPCARIAHTERSFAFDMGTTCEAFHCTGKHPVFNDCVMFAATAFSINDYCYLQALDQRGVENKAAGVMSRYNVGIPL